MPKTHSSLLLIGLALFSFQASATEAPLTLAPLIETIRERLHLAEKVALYKLNHQLPVADHEREIKVIASAQLEGEAYPIPQSEIRQLFIAQIAANRLVQYTLLAKWQVPEHIPQKPVEDLSQSIRPHLDRLQTRLLKTYADFSSSRHDPHCREWVKQAHERQRVNPTYDLALKLAIDTLCPEHN
jgi:chorismate mutase